jgi:predicted ATPase
VSEPAAQDGTPAFPGVPFITRVRLKNYKSIAECDVRLGPLTILVGPNGSGKSNFLDALAFLARAVQTTLAEAIDERGGLDEIIRRVPDRVGSFTIAIEASGEGGPATYEIQVDRSAELVNESATIVRRGRSWDFTVKRGHVRDSAGLNVRLEPTELLLSDHRQFYAFARALSRMQFYNFEAETLRTPQQPTAARVLGSAGQYLGDVLGRISIENPADKARLDAYLRAIVPDVLGVDPYSAGGYATVALRTDGGGPASSEIEFGPKSMSDGTIRAVGVLTALFQPSARDGRVPLVGIEEPETALHPAAAGALYDVLTESSERVQVIAASQSGDLLDREDLDISAIRPVLMTDGQTVIGEVDDASREIAEKRLHTLGELMRADQLEPRIADRAP